MMARKRAKPLLAPLSPSNSHGRELCITDPAQGRSNASFPATREGSVVTSQVSETVFYYFPANLSQFFIAEDRLYYTVDPA